jgi:hypothetical protein
VASLHLPHWRRGRELLKHNKEFPKNPRLPVNRGIFVKQTSRPGGRRMKDSNMNIRHQIIPTEFGPETRFEVAPVLGPFRAVATNRFEHLKGRLLSERLEEIWEPAFISQVRVTPYPLLVFPLLFEEKADSAIAVAERQEQVRRHSRNLLAL